MHALLCYTTPAGRLRSPRSVKVLLWHSRLRRRRPARHFAALADIQAEIVLRELWIQVHQAAGSEERAEELGRECVVLRRELSRAADFHLGVTIDRVAIEA